MSSRVALLGLSGVGKSTFLQKVSLKTEFLHLQASDLIKAEQLLRAVPPDTSEGLRTGSVAENQLLLIAAFERAAQVARVPIVFDGHCIIDGKNGLISISYEVFLKLQFDTVFHLSATPEVIMERRLADIYRERPNRDLETISKHQQASIKAAKQIANKLGCQLVNLESHQIELMIGALQI